MVRQPTFYGLLAEFDGTEALLKAARQAYESGYRKLDAYSPAPIHGLAEAMGFRYTRLPLVVFVGGMVGGLTGFLLQYGTSVIAYPLNVGGRPLNSWPAFVPVTFEMTILVASLSAVVGMILMNGLPRPYHPVFNVTRFERASQDGYFLCIEAADPRFDREETRSFLEGLGAVEVFEVED